MVESSSPQGMLQGWLVELLVVALPVIGTAVIMLLKYYAGKLMERIKASDAEKEAIQCLLEGMAVAQEEIVRGAKKAAEDGKLTKEEIELAKKTALAHALTVAKGPALDVLKEMGKERAGSLIKQLLAKLSSKKESK